MYSAQIEFSPRHRRALGVNLLQSSVRSEAGSIRPMYRWPFISIHTISCRQPYRIACLRQRKSGPPWWIESISLFSRNTQNAGHLCHARTPAWTTIACRLPSAACLLPTWRVTHPIHNLTPTTDNNNLCQHTQRTRNHTPTHPPQPVSKANQPTAPADTAATGTHLANTLAMRTSPPPQT